MYGYGANDPDTGNPINIISVNNNKAYVEDVSWFIAKGMTKDEIYTIPRCVQETDYTSNDITDKNDLLRTTQEELSKVCVPTLNGKINISDFSILEDTAITEPMLGEQIIVIDQDVNFNLTAQIQTIERKYSENPYDVSIEISNVIKYDSVFKDLQNSSDTVKTITSINNGVPVVNVSYTQGTINAFNTPIIGTVDLTTSPNQQSSISILFEDRRVGYPTFGAMGFGTKGLCIANEINADGTWKWQTFGNNKGFNASLIKTGILQASNGDFSFDLLNNLTHVKTQNQGTSDNQIASTEFVQNELNNRQNIIIGTITSAITVGEGDITLIINGLGMNNILVSNGNYSLNTAQIVGITNTDTDTISVHYINGIAGNCKFNYTYSK
jgi:hypothetical protein